MEISPSPPPTPTPTLTLTHTAPPYVDPSLSEYGVYEADLTTRSIPYETAIPSDGPIMICAERSVFAKSGSKVGGHLEQTRNERERERERERGVESPFPTANSVLPSTSDRDA